MASFALLAAVTNLLAASLAVSGGVFYVLVYTVWLKRRTAQNIVIGGAAGAIPPLAGWAAAHGSLGLGALYLFLIVLLWTPPHFWALALLLAPHYEAAQVPMMPVVRGASATARQVLGYTLLLTAVTVVPFVTGTFGAVYLVAAIGLGGGVLRAGGPDVARAGRAAGGGAVSLLAAVPGPAVRRRRARRGRALSTNDAEAVTLTRAPRGATPARRARARAPGCRGRALRG